MFQERIGIFIIYLLATSTGIVPVLVLGAQAISEKCYGTYSTVSFPIFSSTGAVAPPVVQKSTGGQLHVTSSIVYS